MARCCSSKQRVVSDLRQMILDAKYEAEFEESQGAAGDPGYWRQVIVWAEVALAAVQKRRKVPRK